MSTSENNVVVIVRIPVPKFAPKWLVRKKMKATVDLYSSIDGLEFKLFTFETESGDFGGIYTWRDSASAEKWFNPEWFARIQRERGNEAYVRYFDAPLSIDNMQGGTPASMGGSCVATLVEIPIPQGVSRELVVEGFAGAEETYRNVGGLLRKHFILGSHGTFGGVYLWDSKASAHSWFNDQWRKRVSETYGNPPTVEWFEVPIVLPARK
jgi:heme-degrading monooxygenase HmoA